MKMQKESKKNQERTNKKQRRKKKENSFCCFCFVQGPVRCVVLWVSPQATIAAEFFDSLVSQPRGWSVLLMYRFSASFPYKLVNFPLLNE
jgi:hypothetical protein